MLYTLCACFIAFAHCISIAAEDPPEAPLHPVLQEREISPFHSFTGKINGSRVRLRLQPHLDSPILKEYTQTDYVQVVGQTGDFYEVLPDRDLKGYVFRSYILDNIVEAHNVNIRLKPDMNGLVLAQLQQGETIKGNQCPDNPKWLEIDLPSSVRLYVAKEFVNHAGPLALYDEIHKKKYSFTAQFQQVEETITKELSKAFEQIDLATITKQLQQLIDRARELFPELEKQARGLLTKLQEEYLKLSIAAKTKALQQLMLNSETAPADSTPEKTSAKHEPYASFFLQEQETKFLRERQQKTDVADNIQAFYQQELKENSLSIKGKIVPYERGPQARPGDFLLIHPSTKVPIAYIYSTKVDIQPFIGQAVVLQVSARPNYDFALPAYFVHTIATAK